MLLDADMPSRGRESSFSPSMSSKIGNMGTSFSSCVDAAGDWFRRSPSTYDFRRRLPSVTRHSTSSSLQLVHGMPLSTTSQRTLRERQQWHAFDALRFTLRPPDDIPAADCFLLLLAGWVGAVMVATAMLKHGKLGIKGNMANQCNFVACNHPKKELTLWVEVVAARNRREIECDDEMAKGRIL